MNARELLSCLMTRSGDNACTLSTKVKVPPPTLYNFLTGSAKAPRRSTLEPIANYYGIPVEAFLSENVREKVAATLLFQQGVRGPADVG